MLPVGVTGAILAGLGATLLAFAAPFLPAPVFGLVAIPVALLAWAMGGSGVLLLSLGERWSSALLAAAAWAGAGAACVVAIAWGASDLLAHSRAGTEASLSALLGLALLVALGPAVLAGAAGWLAAGPMRALATALSCGAPVVASMSLLIALVDFGLPLSA